MTVTFLKQHLQYNINDTVDLPEDIANYLLRVGVVTIREVDETTIEKALTNQLKKTKKKK